MTDRAVRIYLDHNASAPLRAAAREAMLAAADLHGNPSSVHREGQMAKAVLERARDIVGRFAGAPSEQVIFTSGATEAAATLLSPLWTTPDGEIRFDCLAVLDADHPALREGGRFAAHELSRLPVDADGRCDLPALDRWLEANGRPLVAVAAANGETGVVQDVEPIAERVHAYGGRLVVDASQVAGRLPIEPFRGSADALILSSHKMGGPKGIGAIILRRDDASPRPLLTGGAQELRRRAGTPAPMLAAGFAATVEDVVSEVACAERMAGLRDAFEARLAASAPVAILAQNAPRLPQTSAFQLLGQRAETVQIAADLAGIAISAGSACQSGKLGRSEVLSALRAGGADVDPELGLVRASFCAATTAAELMRLAEVVAALAERTRKPITRAA